MKNAIQRKLYVIKEKSIFSFNLVVCATDIVTVLKDVSVNGI